MQATKPKFEFIEGPHQYLLDGIEIPRVTQVGEAVGAFTGMEFWTEEARQRGSAVHAATHYYDEGDLDYDSVDPTIRPYLDAYILFEEESGFRPDIVEQCFVNEGFRFAGRPDRIKNTVRKSELFPRKCIIDIKTGAREGWHAVQLAGYALLMNEPYGYDRFAPYL